MKFPRIRLTVGRMMAAIAIGTVLVIATVELARLLERRSSLLDRSGSAAAIAASQGAKARGYEGLAASYRDARSKGLPVPVIPTDPPEVTWDRKIAWASGIAKVCREDAQRAEAEAERCREAARHPWRPAPSDLPEPR